MTILLIVCTTLFSMFGIFVITASKGDRQANVLLGIFFLLWAIDFLDGYLLLSGFYLKHPALALWTETTVFLYGPLIYFYTLRILKAEALFRWTKFLHLIPFILLSLVNIFSFHLLPRDKKLEVVEKISLVWTNRRSSTSL